MDAQGRRRVHFQTAHINGLAAILAIAELTFVQSAQGSGDSLQFQLPTPHLFL
jgi:hypothetical protein